MYPKTSLLPKNFLVNMQNGFKDNFLLLFVNLLKQLYAYCYYSMFTPIHCPLSENIALHSYVLYYTVHVLYCTYCTVLYCTVLYCTELYCTELYCTVLYCTKLYCTCTALYLYCTVLYCTVLYCTVLYCTVLYCTVLYCTVLYCTVL
jgi:hypothetical protein